MVKIIVSLLVITALHISHGWDTFFNFSPCYQKMMEERMPLSMDNFIALIEQYERLNYNTAPEDIANALLYRYRKNGIVFKPNANVKWSTFQEFEIYKQDVDDQLLKLSIVIPPDTFMPREECSLQMSISHSVDIYPFAGVDYMWSNNNNYNNNNNNNQYGRKRRATTSSSSSNANYGLDSSSGVTDYATHPIENGVVQSGSGPIAVGLLLAGISTMGSSNSYTVSELVGRDKADAYMPNEMKSKRVDSLFGSTLSGELAQAAILTGKMDGNNFEVGPAGKFGNSTSCPRAFSLEKLNINSYFTRAEVYAAVDALIIAKVMSSATTGTTKLSQILRMYYGNHGLLNGNVKSCNRNNIYNSIKNEYKTAIQENALNYMYVYQNYFSDLKNLVAQQTDDFNYIQNQFQNYLEPVIRSVDSFMGSSSYNNQINPTCISTNDKDYQLESLTDLVVIFTPIGSVEDVANQAEYIALTARQIGVGYDRSRMAVYNGKSYNWVTPMRNVSNIADYACNYTTFRPYGTISSQEFLKVLEALSVFYMELYNYFHQRPNENSKRSQVVVWNLPNSFSDNELDMKIAWDKFNASYPDVSFIFVGDKINSLQDIFTNEEDVINVPVSNKPEETAAEVVYYIQRSPKMFIYPACDTLDPDFANYNENNHIYTAYVTPNFTSLIRIPPQNFRFSGHLVLKFKTSDVTVCISRVNKIPSKNDQSKQTKCQDMSTTSTPFEQDYLCDRYVSECAAVYIAVSGNPNSKKICSNKECLFPNQIEFELTHEGMICGCWNIAPAPVLMIIASLLLFLRF